MTFQNLTLEEKEPGLLLLTVSRPQSLNALNSATLAEIGAAAARVAATAGARALLITGAGEKAFVAGADISEMRDFSAGQARDFCALAQASFRALEELPVPVIALVNGYALGGGCELALACDIILASEKAVFGQPEVNLGIPPGFGGTQRLPRLVGRARALEMILTARQVKADEALAIGLANALVPAGELLERGLAMARTIAAKGPLAVKLAKRAVHRGLDVDLASGCAIEADAFGLACATADQKEGMAAFLEKRPARFKGE